MLDFFQKKKGGSGSRLWKRRCIYKTELAQSGFCFSFSSKVCLVFLRFSCASICVTEVSLNPIDSGPDTAQSTQGKRPASKKTTAPKTGGALHSHPSHLSPTRGRGEDRGKQKRDNTTSPVKSASDYSSSPEKCSLSSSQGSSTRLLLQCCPKKGLSFNITMHSCSCRGKCANHFDTSGHVGADMGFLCVVIFVFPFYQWWNTYVY